MAWSPTPHAGIEEKVIFDEPGFPDRTSLERWAAGTAAADRRVEGGAEVFVISGRVEDASGAHDAGTWIRIPPGAAIDLRAATDAELYVKTGGVAALRPA